MAADVPHEGPTAALRPLAAIHASAPPQPELKMPAGLTLSPAVSLAGLQVAQADLGAAPAAAPAITRVGPSSGNILHGINKMLTTGETGCNFDLLNNSRNLQEVQLRIEAMRVMAGTMLQNKTPGYATTGFTVPKAGCDIRIGMDTGGNTYMLVREGPSAGRPQTKEEAEAEPVLDINTARGGKDFGANLRRQGNQNGIPKDQYMTTYVGFIGGKERNIMFRHVEDAFDPRKVGIPLPNGATTFTPGQKSNLYTSGQKLSTLPSAIETNNHGYFTNGFKWDDRKTKYDLPNVPEVPLPGAAPAGQTAPTEMPRTINTPHKAPSIA